ncbi:hypothetical protein BZA70DRAFT_272455 [Myxozyma melibiosi]|uniref:Uncharacterized protein n=1 Tax=Myxozyma melibiosi TaxID=54550 RepID=A0ABR1FDG6_9ASCO
MSSDSSINVSRISLPLPQQILDGEHITDGISPNLGRLHRLLQVQSNSDVEYQESYSEAADDAHDNGSAPASAQTTSPLAAGDHYPVITETPSIYTPQITFPRSALRRSNSIRRRENTYLESLSKRRKRDGKSVESLWSEKPATLSMKMIYCDGGWHGDNYLPENVLLRDSSVYCAQKSKCNMILRHSSHKPFTLHSITIKAPTTGYTCPVQQGLIFVSMNKDDLLPRTKYHDQQIDNLAESQTQLPVSSSVEYSAMPRSPRIPRYEFGQPNSSFDFYWGRPNPNPFSSEPGDSLSSDLADSDQADVEHIEGLGSGDDLSFSDSAYYHGRQSFRPYAQYRQDLARSSLRHTRDRLLDARRQRHRSLAGDNTSRDVRIINTENITLPSYDISIGDEPRTSTEAPPTLFTHPLLPTDEAEALTPSLPHTDSLVLEPIARFKIPDNKSRCTIVFDSPVSACYLYIKFYSSDPKRDIDIQGVYINGFVGPRCFPKISLR